MQKIKELTEVVETILSIGSFEQKCVILKGDLVLRTKKNMINIGLEQSLSNIDKYEHIY